MFKFIRYYYYRVKKIEFSLFYINEIDLLH